MRVQRPGRRRQRQADDDGDHQGRGVVGGVGLDQVAPRNGAEPPQPGGVGVVGRGPQGEGDPQRAQGRPPRAPRVAGQLARHRGYSHQGPADRRHDARQGPGARDRQFLHAPGQGRHDHADPGRVQRHDPGHDAQGGEQGSPPSGARPAQQLHQALVLVGPQRPAGQEHGHETGAHHQVGADLPLGELADSPGQRQDAVEQARAGVGAHGPDEHGPRLQRGVDGLVARRRRRQRPQGQHPGGGLDAQPPQRQAHGPTQPAHGPARAGPGPRRSPVRRRPPRCVRARHDARRRPRRRARRVRRLVHRGSRRRAHRASS